MKLKPIINDNPEAIDEILKETGIKKEGNSLKDILSNSGMGLENVIQNLANLAFNAGDDAVRLRAIDTGLKLHKVMDDEKAAAPVINITIQSVNGNREMHGIASILVPRTIEVKSQLEG